jgi:hypothetical protein
MVTKKEPRWIMPYPKCPKCGVGWTIDENTYYDGEYPIACYHCETQFIVRLQTLGGSDRQGLTGYGLQQRVVWIKPLVDKDLLEGLLIPVIPKEIFNDFEAALYCFGAGVPPRAVAVMCRYTIQHALILKGIPEDKPEKMLNVAREKQKLSQVAIDQAHAAVFMGDKGGHPQKHWTLEITSDDAKQAVLMTKRVLMELWPNV